MEEPETENETDVLYEIIDNPSSCLVKSQVHGNDKVKVLLICPNGEQRLYTFEMPGEDCTVKDLLDEARIIIDEGLNVFLIKDETIEMNYIVQYISVRPSVSEEGSKRSDYGKLDIKSSSRTADKSYSSLLEEDCGDYSMAENKTNEGENALLKLEEEGPVPSKIEGKWNRHTLEPRLFEDLESLFDTSSDEEDQRKGTSEKQKLDNVSSTIVDDTDDKTIFEKEPAIANSNANSTVSGNTSDYRENIDGGGVPCKIENMALDSTIESPHTFLICGTVMVGSYHYTPQEKVIVSPSGVRLRAPHLNDNTNFVILELKFEDILKVLIYSGETMPVLFFYARVDAANMIRECLGMQDPEGPYYKPLSQERTQRLIILRPDEITEESKLVLKTLFLPKKLLAELTREEAGNLLLSVSPKTIHPQILSLMKNFKQTTSAVHNTVNNALKMPIKKAQSTTQMVKLTRFPSDSTVNDENQIPLEKDQKAIQILEQTRSKLDNTVNIRGKRFVKKILSLTEISKRTKTILENTVDRENVPVFKQLETSLKRPKESASTANHFLNSEIQTLVIYPPPPAKGGIAITAQDYACLREGNFLNDVIIDFYLRYLTLQVLSEADEDRTHIFSVHFYKRLTSPHLSSTDSDTLFSLATKRHFNVRKWTKNINIFEKDFIIIPINEHAHWFLAIICFPGLVGKAQVSPSTGEAYNIKKIYKRRGAKEMKLQEVSTQNQKEIKRLPCILIFDSLASSSSRAQSVINTLRDYLYCEYLTKLGTERVFSEKTMKGTCPKVPQQHNFSDCGLYVLQYVESFFSNPITDYTLPIKTLEHWFDDDVVTRKRGLLSQLIKKLMECS